MKVSDLLGKSVISLSDAQVLGYVINVWFDGKFAKAKTLEVANDEEDARHYTELRTTKADGDAAMVKSAFALRTQNLTCAVLPCPIGRLCYNQSGKSLGKVRDVELTGNVTERIVCEKGTFTPAQLLSTGNDMCIFNDSDEKIKISKPKKPRPAKPATPPSPPAPPAPQSNVQTPPAPQSVTVTRTPGEPMKDYSFLLGKPVHSPVYAGARILIPAGTVVNEHAIELCRRENKLVQLALRAY